MLLNGMRRTFMLLSRWLKAILNGLHKPSQTMTMSRPGRHCGPGKYLML